MEYDAVISVLRRKWRDIAVAAFMLGTLTFFLAIVTTERYDVRTDYLIVQNGINERDLYSLSKSAEYAGNVLSDAIFSQLFIDEAARTGHFHAALLPQEPRERIAAWGRMVSVRKNFQSNILTVRVLDDDPALALGIANAVSQVLTEKNSLFRTGTPDSITLKVISGPITEKNPSVSMLAMVTILGAAIGAAFGIGLSLIRQTRMSRSSMPVPGPENAYEEHLYDIARRS